MNETLSNDYFATQLLKELDQKDPVIAAYEAQDISRNVGFDFETVEEVLWRAHDEVRETTEAHQDYITDPSDETRAHLGDEISDLVFSGINLGRHKALPADEFPELIQVNSTQEDLSVEETLEQVSDAMKAVAEATAQAEVVQGVSDIFRAAGRLALQFEFDIADLTRENTRKYLTRCAAIEDLAEKDGKQWRDLADNGEIITYWKAAKALL